MHSTEPNRGTPALNAREFLDFVLDEAGSVDLTERPGLSCRRGAIDGNGIFAAALSSNGSERSVLDLEALADLARFARSAAAEGSPLLVVLDNPIVADDALRACHDLCGQLALCRGKVPVVSLVLGPCIGFAAIAATLADLVYCGPQAVLAMADAEVTSVVTGVPPGDGSDRAFASLAGIADALFQSEFEALLGVRRLAGFLPSSGGPQWRVCDQVDRHEPSLSRLVGSNANAPLDIVQLVRKVVDDGDWLETKRDFGRGLLTGLARLDGVAVGLLANVSAERSGVLDGDSLVKANSFVELCGRLGLPIVTIVDSPGVLPGFGADGTAQVARAAALLAALSSAQGPVISLITRRAFGAVFPTMVPPTSQRSRVITWPTARVGMTEAKLDPLPAALTVAPAATRAALIGALHEIQRGGR